MSSSSATLTPAEIHYPDSDGQPMADNTLQWQWMVTIKENLEDLFREDSDVFVAGDLLWYPVEGSNQIRVAPDVLVAFGRPKGYRGSYMQWREEDVAPQVVFEILSPGNRPSEMVNKALFYARYGVEEFYLFDPDTGDLNGSLRSGGTLASVEQMDGWVSPRLGIRFHTSGGELQLFHPDGRPFLSFVEISRQLEAERQRAEVAEAAALEMSQQVETERQAAAAERERARRLEEQLRALGIEPAS